jgi:hypothetical protein
MRGLPTTEAWCRQIGQIYLHTCANLSHTLSIGAVLQVPLAQKWLIQKANLAGKPAFVAGQARGPGRQTACLRA